MGNDIHLLTNFFIRATPHQKGSQYSGIALFFKKQRFFAYSSSVGRKSHMRKLQTGKDML